MNFDLIHPDSELDANDRSFVADIRRFAADKLAPHARRIDEEEVFRAESVAELAEAGILAGPIGTEAGGGGWSPMQLALAHEEIGAVCGNTRGFLAVQCGLVAHAFEVHARSDEHKRWLAQLLQGKAIGCFAMTEPEAGSDVAAMQTRAEREGDRWRIHGEKVWITNGGIADVAIVFAQADPDGGKDGITAFVVPTDRTGLKRRPMPGRDLGHRGSDHAILEFDGLAVSEADILGKPGEGFALGMAALGAGRLSVAAGAVGVHRAALESSLDWCARRQQFGKPIARFQMVQERLADMGVELLASRALVHRCARRRAAGTESPGDLAAAKLYSTEAAARAADQAIQLHGSRGYSSEYPVERLLRDITALRIYEGTSMIQKGIFCRDLLSNTSGSRTRS